MNEKLPETLRTALAAACRLHERASSDAAQCQEFNQRMSRLLVELEDAECFDVADRVMGILLHCLPKDGAHCDKAKIVAEKMKKFGQL